MSTAVISEKIHLQEPNCLIGNRLRVVDVVVQAKVFDVDAVLCRLGGDQELLQDLVQFFHEDAPVLVGEIHRAAQHDDALAVQRAAHSLKGLVANFSADAAIAAALRLERLGQSGNLAETFEALRDLEHHLAVLLQALASYRRPAAS